MRSFSQWSARANRKITKKIKKQSCNRGRRKAGSAGAAGRRRGRKESEKNMATIFVGPGNEPWRVSNFDVGTGDTAGRSFGGRAGQRSGPKWPEAPGVCKFRLIEKNDEVPVYPPVSISSHYFYSGAFYRNGRPGRNPLACSLARSLARAIYILNPRAMARSGVRSLSLSRAPYCRSSPSRPPR